MNTSKLNFRHLYYFWVVAKEGSITRAADRLDVAVQTISAQLSLLEQSVGKSLLAPQGRRLVLTEAGRIALAYADQIFLLSEQMMDTLATSDTEHSMRLTVGISDSVPKLITSHLLEAALALPQRVRLVCYEYQLDNLLADLALHKLDVVLTDRALPTGSTLRVFSHMLFESEMTVVGTAALAQLYSPAFPKNLNGAPFLLPTRNNALRLKIDEWFELQGVHPDIVGEFEDNALLNTFGRRGLGLFFAPAALAADLAEQLQAVLVGRVPEVREQFYAISNERKIQHPAVEAILASMHQEGIVSG